MIVRVLGEGQFEVDDEVAKGLNDLDDQAERALEDFTSDQTQLDRELGAIASKSEVDKELEQMKAELGPGDAKKELSQ